MQIATNKQHTLLVSLCNLDGNVRRPLEDLECTALSTGPVSLHGGSFIAIALRHKELGFSHPEVVLGIGSSRQQRLQDRLSWSAHMSTTLMLLCALVVFQVQHWVWLNRQIWGLLRDIRLERPQKHPHHAPRMLYELYRSWHVAASTSVVCTGASLVVGNKQKGDVAFS